MARAKTFEAVLKEHRSRLKAAKCRLTIEQRGDRLCLRGVLPPKPGSARERPYTQRIPTRARAHVDGVKWAFEAAKRLDAQLMEGTFSWAVQDAPRESLEGFLDLWKQYCEFRAKELEAPATIYNMYRPLGHHLERFGEPIANKHAALALIADLRSRMSDTSVRKYVGMLRRFFEWMRSRKMWEGANPFSDLGAAVKFRRTVKTKRDAFTQDEVRRILEAVKASQYYSHYYSFVKFLFVTGARPSEATALLWRHIGDECEYIDFEEALVHGGGNGQPRLRKQNKTARWRRFPCGDRLQALLQEIEPESRSPEDFVFLGPHGKPINPRNFSRRCWKSSLAAAGVRYRNLYKYRSTFISHALQSGADPYEIAEMAGHDPKILFDHYADIIRPVKIIDLNYEGEDDAIE